MKIRLRVFGIIALAALIGFVSCDNGTGGDASRDSGSLGGVVSKPPSGSNAADAQEGVWVDSLDRLHINNVPLYLIDTDNPDPHTPIPAPETMDCELEVYTEHDYVPYNLLLQGGIVGGKLTGVIILPPPPAALRPVTEGLPAGIIKSGINTKFSGFFIGYRGDNWWEEYDISLFSQPIVTVNDGYANPHGYPYETQGKQYIYQYTDGDVVASGSFFDTDNKDDNPIKTTMDIKMSKGWNTFWYTQEISGNSYTASSASSSPPAGAMWVQSYYY